jgi:hypothetical protein
VNFSGMPIGLATSSAAPFVDKLRMVQLIALRPNSIVPAFSTRLRGTVRFSTIGLARLPTWNAVGTKVCWAIWSGVPFPPSGTNPQRPRRLTPSGPFLLSPISKMLCIGNGLGVPMQGRVQGLGSIDAAKFIELSDRLSGQNCSPRALLRWKPRGGVICG